MHFKHLIINRYDLNITLDYSKNVKNKAWYGRKIISIFKIDFMLINNTKF